MVGVGFESEDAPAPVEKITLSAGQIRELAGYTGLVMASTVFFLTPLVLLAPQPSLEMAPLERLTVPLSVSVVTLGREPAAMAPSSRLRSRAAAPRAQGGSRVRPAAPLAPSRTFVASGPMSAPAKGAAKEVGPDQRKSGPNGLLRALVGSGRYRVQPFPLPASGE